MEGRQLAACDYFDKHRRWKLLGLMIHYLTPNGPSIPLHPNFVFLGFSSFIVFRPNEADAVPELCVKWQVLKLACGQGPLPLLRLYPASCLSLSDTRWHQQSAVNGFLACKSRTHTMSYCTRCLSPSLRWLYGLQVISFRWLSILSYHALNCSFC